MMPNFIVLFFIILVVLTFLVVLKKYAKPGTPIAFPYQAKKSLCSPAERSFLGVLEQLLSNKYRILLKVRLADLIEIEKGVSKSLRQGALNRISRKHVDFVVCGKDDLSILGVIELDDKSHKSAKRQERDSFLDSAMNAAGIPILHIQAQNAYSISDIREQLQNRFEFLTNKAEPELPPPVKDSNEQEYIKPTSDDTETNGTCTDCGAPLVKRQAKKGKFAGQSFMACSNFPKCRKIVPIKQVSI
jgi:very-short-patch-repair endonuclease